MISDFISITDLQRHLKKVFSSKKQPVRIVLSNNKIRGVVFSEETAKLLVESGILDQLREELWELNDPETVKLVRDSREGKDIDSIPFDEWLRKGKLTN